MKHKQWCNRFAFVPRQRGGFGMKRWMNVHYHWVVAASMLVQLAVYIGILNNFTSLYVLPVTQDLGINRSAFSLAISARYLTSFLATMVSGVLFTRYGHRRLILLGLPAAAFAFCLLSSSRSVATIAISAAIIGVCDSVCSTPGSARVIGDWFHRWRGTVLGVVSAFTGVGGSLFCMALSGIMQRSSWRQSHWFSAAMLLAVMVIMALAACDRPENKGLRPFGEGERPTKKRHGDAGDLQWAGFGLSELKGQGTFYLMILCTFLTCLFVYMGFYTTVPHMQDCGLTAEEAAWVQSYMLVLLSGVKLLIGVLIDRIGARLVAVLCVCCCLAGHWLMAGIHDVPSAMLAISVFTFGIPSTSLTVPLLTVQLFGYKAHLTAEGVFMAMINVGAMVASPLINTVYDRLGSYSPAFRTAAVLQILLIGLYALLFSLAAKKKRIRQAAEQTAV